MNVESVLSLSDQQSLVYVLALLGNGRAATLVFSVESHASHAGTAEFDRRFFLLGVFLLLFALGAGEEPRGDPNARLVITRQIPYPGPASYFRSIPAVCPDSDGLDVILRDRTDPSFHSL